MRAAVLLHAAPPHAASWLRLRTASPLRARCCLARPPARLRTQLAGCLLCCARPLAASSPRATLPMAAALQVREMFAFSFACAVEHWDLEITVRTQPLSPIAVGMLLITGDGCPLPPAAPARAAHVRSGAASRIRCSSTALCQRSSAKLRRCAGPTLLPPSQQPPTGPLIIQPPVDLRLGNATQVRLAAPAASSLLPGWGNFSAHPLDRPLLSIRPGAAALPGLSLPSVNTPS